MTRDFSDHHRPHTTNGAYNVNGDNEVTGYSKPIENPTRPSSDVETLDVLVVGGGFAGVYLLYQLRKRGFSVKAVEMGSDIGGVWHWNRYPGARVDTQYPVYCYSLPEVWEDWEWTSEYPDWSELQRYFQHVDSKLGVKKDMVFNTKITAANFDEKTNEWTIHCNTGKTYRSQFFIASTGFAAKRYIPEYDGIDTFQGTMHHSSFWPSESVDVKGLRVGVLGSGSTGIQITQEWADEIGETGSLKMFQRTPNLCLPMKQKLLTPEEQVEHKTKYEELFKQRLNSLGGFLYQPRQLLTFDHTREEQLALYEELWEMGGFRFLMNNYSDMTKDVKANLVAYNFWRDKTRPRILDQKTADILVPMDPPHPFGAKRLALEQGIYEKFNRPNVNVVDIKSHPIVRFEPEGIRTADGILHELDILAIATGFDSVTGGLKDIAIQGSNGEHLADKWKNGVNTYLGMATSGFPNFFFTYGPQAPTAFSNGPACIEVQADWMVNLLVKMRHEGIKRFDADKVAETKWKVTVHDLSSKGLRHYTDSWYNGANIPGKPREPLNYAGGIPMYRQTLQKVREENYAGFSLK
ncbi:hypothetical protein N7463_001520 [Penicillium fimorum]|uniref:L-ornithine N(5)-monooxygenase n=1 Tax=Penicillium fimorum TaxID=1882269 RepID=A0A9X0CD15_9EURO|nr:hypothetical protein N7463_001520 [Penicillium fimorum]